MITLHPVKSSNISHVGHDPKANELAIKFKSGGDIFIYSGVTAVQHADLVTAESIGSHFHHHIRHKHTSRKLENV